MSLWFYGREKNGRRPLYSIGLHPSVVVGGGAAIIAVLLPLISVLRHLFR